MERLSKPFTVLSCEGLSVMNVSPNSMSHFGVMRRAISEEISVSRVPPPSGVTMLETVGSESSSATNGSSVVSVAGKNLLPAKPCAHTVVGTTNKTAAKVTIFTAADSIGLKEKIRFNLELLSVVRKPRVARVFPHRVGRNGLRSAHSHGAVQWRCLTSRLSA